MSFFGKDKDKEEVKEMPVKQTGSLKERLDRINKSRWIRFGIVSALFFGWVAWLGSWWVLVFWFLLFDIYITKFVPRHEFSDVDVEQQEPEHQYPPTAQPSHPAKEQGGNNAEANPATFVDTVKAFLQRTSLLHRHFLNFFFIFVFTEKTHTNNKLMC